MNQNLKVDVIYYNTNTDFEMEFNMCGCCKMRLLTDKTDDQKNYIHMLARGVARSRIILCVGKLFGERGIIATTALALRAKLVNADKDDFGISGEEDIKIIDGSIPLVTSDGYFGGCIIEHGPQALILLSENKNVRKDIMEGLIHPYIKDLNEIAQTPVAQNSAEQAQENVEPQDIEETEETVNEEIIEQIPEETESINNTENEIVSEVDHMQNNDNEKKISDEHIDFSENMVLNDDYDPEDFIKYNDRDDDGMLDNEFGFISENESKSKISHNKMRKINLLVVALMILLAISLVVIVLCALIIPRYNNVNPSGYIRHIFFTLFNKL